MMLKTLPALTALLPLAALLASCATTTAPHPDAPASLQAQNADICPSCGRLSLSAWVLPAPAAELPVAAERPADDLAEFQPEPPKGGFSPAVPAVVSYDGHLLHLTVVTGEDRARPVACFQPAWSARPGTLPALTLQGDEALNTWTGGLVELSAAVTQAKLSSAEAADRWCVQEFGLSWRALRMNDTTDLLPLGVRPTDTWAATQP
ncbi:hypothetical protein LAJ19_14395 (plasmid) [Deinococcus taeanensis]|uniref:hypothetical protein n=1 Tax=Deinococcus taeanensis TaxID=2737050 RepID=UPI001CDCD760|nr:hypothetical protein [Deinococcus taeanensis]UBV44354.1 hypothetical protein LAJ19_14395 [Deinococcus taeanensis]